MLLESERSYLLVHLIIQALTRVSHRYRRAAIAHRQSPLHFVVKKVILDYLHEVCFQQCGLGRTILGPPENVRSLTRQQLQDYITTHYTAPRMVVVGAGALEHDRLVEMADKCFGNLPRHPPQGAIVTVRGACGGGMGVRGGKAFLPLPSWRGCQPPQG